MAGDRPVLVGLLLYLLIALAPAVVFWGLLRARGWCGALRDRWCVWRGTVRPVPTGPPLEAVVADVRRLRRALRTRRPPTRVRQVALLAAYDDALVDLCGVLGVDTQLAASARGDRDYERLMTEAAVEHAGVALDVSAPGDAAA